ncbi:MAG: response regulator transcription factor [Crocinitomicaceae bacterium]
MIRVAIIDDNPAILYGVQAAIQKNDALEFVFSSATADDFLEQLKTLQVDVLVVDIVLEDGISLNFLDLLRKTYPTKKIIAFSNAEGNSIQLYLQRIGVDELVSKKEPIETLIASILQFDPETNSIVVRTKNQESLVLSERELEIIQLLGKGFSSPDIAENLHISHNTVNFHKKKLLKKFHVDSIALLIRDAVELGILRD